MRLSVNLVTYNEEANIRDALESVKWADEIVVVDSGSEDRTVEICSEYTDRIVQRPWPGFIEQKNFALDQCRAPWVLNLDADERVSPELKEAILNALEKPAGCDGFLLKRHTFFLGRWINHSGWYPDLVLRLFRKDKGLWTGYEPHAAVSVTGKVGTLEGDLHHYSYRDLSHHLEVLNRYSSSASQAFAEQDRRCRWSDLALRPVVAFLKKFFVKQGFRDGTRGLMVAYLSAFSVFIKYAKLWERRATATKADKSQPVSQDRPQPRETDDS